MSNPKIIIISNGGIIQSILSNIHPGIEIEVEIREQSKYSDYENLDNEIELKQKSFRNLEFKKVR